VSSELDFKENEQITEQGLQSGNGAVSGNHRNKLEHRVAKQLAPLTCSGAVVTGQHIHIIDVYIILANIIRQFFSWTFKFGKLVL